MGVNPHSFQPINVAYGEEGGFRFAYISDSHLYKKELNDRFVRSLLRRYVPQRLPPKPVELSVSPRVVSIKKAAPERS